MNFGMQNIVLDSLYKKDFPIFANNPGLIYLDSSSSAQKPKSVIDAVSHYYENDYANVHRAIYGLSERSTALFEEARAKVAEFIGAASSQQIVFTKNATESVNLVAYAWAERNLNPGDTILVTILEHHSNFVPWFELAKKKGLNLKIVELNLDQNITADEIIAEIDDSVKFLAITQMSNSLGTKIDVDTVVSYAKNRGVVTLVDACQSVAHMPVEFEEIGADFMVFSGHKLYGPTGVGVLCVSQEMARTMEPFLYGGDMIRSVSKDEVLYAEAPSRFEAGTPDVAGVIGLGVAVDYLKGIGMDQVELNDSSLCDYAFDKLLEVEGVRVLGPQTKGLRASGIAFVMDRVHAHDVAQILSDSNVCVRAGHHCTQPLMKALGVVSSVRMSFGVYNSFADVDRAIEVLKTVPEIFKKKVNE
jgi:cysteine desulfurase/selenocysteine lyase